MTNTHTDSQNLAYKLVRGLNENGEPVSNWNSDALFGAGGILSTTEDLGKFVIHHANQNNNEFRLSTKSTFVIDDSMKIGLGWHLLKTKNGQDLIWHNGGTGGYSSSMAIDTNNQLAVIILSNVSAYNSKSENINNLCIQLIGNANRK